MMNPEVMVVNLPRGVVLCVGIVSEHDDDEAEAILDNLSAWLMACPAMPLLPQAMTDDCFVTPPERGSKHVEMRWITV
jgi:hypothetical protein